MLKKTTLAILGLATSGFASAGMYAPAPAPTCTPADVTVPCEATRWDVGVQALYLKPVYSAGRGYEYDTNGQYRNVDGKWDWGYRLEGSYHFNTGNDITMTWVHFGNDTTRNGYSGFTPYSASRVPFGNYSENKFNQVNLVLGQHTDMGASKNARFYGGLQFAKINLDSLNTYSTVPPALIPAGVGELRYFRDVMFNGVGPTIGVDYSYDLPQGFSVTANSAATILSGYSRLNQGYVLHTLTADGVTNNLAYTNRSLVPSLEAKLGLNYACEFAQGSLNIEGGYWAVNYFNVIQTTQPTTDNGIVAPSNYGLYGPYLGLKWVANV